jgi:hypothetical protein
MFFPRKVRLALIWRSRSSCVVACREAILAALRVACAVFSPDWEMVAAAVWTVAALFAVAMAVELACLVWRGRMG